MPTSVGTPVFTAGGLASGLDTNSIIDQLVKLESTPITTAQSRQTAFKTQISQIGQLTTQLGALADAAKALQTNGVLGVAQVGSTSGFTATPGPTATAGRYTMQVDSLATTAKARSTGFGASSLVNGGDLTLGVNGTNYTVSIVDGSSLELVASQINTSGAPVSAAVLNTNGTRYLSISNRDTGFTVGQPASSALTLTENVTGTAGQSLGLAITQNAANAKVTIDGLQFERNNNVITDALPGVTLGLTATTTVASDLVLSNDAASTQANLQKFVDTYNALMTNVHTELDVQAGSARDSMLSGDNSIKTLQSSMQRMVSGVLSTNATIRTLADVGIKTSNDGTLSIDTVRLGNALSSDASAVNALFQTTTTGIGSLTANLNKTFTDGIDGIFTTRKIGLNNSVKRLDDSIIKMQARVDSYRKTLVAQFSAMEQIVSGFKSIGNFLTSQDNQNSKK
jgi:flagellar hook-associated protein 2